MSRFELGKKLNSSLEDQQKEMLSRSKESKPSLEEDLVLVNIKQTERITLRLPKELHTSLKILAKFGDESLNSLIVNACIEFVGKDKNQEFIKKFNKL